MNRGKLVSIYLAEVAEKPTYEVDSVHAVAGKGLEGDRYFRAEGTFSDRPGAGREVTLIELESILALQVERGLLIRPGEARRNLVTEGVALNNLVGKTFWVGEVSLRGIRLCDPCAHLESLTQPGVLSGLVERGGLRADILNDGTLRVGDSISLTERKSNG